MHKRKLLIGLLVAGLFTAGLGAGLVPAAADQRTFQITFVGGTTTVVTLDIPAGTPLDQVKVPGVSLPIVSIQESTPPPATTAAPATTTSTTPPSEPGKKPSGDKKKNTSSSPEPTASKQTSQKTTGNKQRKPQAEVEKSTKVAQIVKATKDRTKKAATTPQGAPTPADASYSFALPGPTPIGVPNFFIEKFRIPPFLLPIYQAAGIQYGVRWEVLAAINEIETDYGRNLNVSSAGAVGWMQFMPATWKRYGTDANSDGRRDPFNPVDAIFAAARYLKAAGADKDIRKAIFSYNHADWYVDSVMLRAKLIGGLPGTLVGSLTGLTQGHFPVHARARYADDVSERQANKRYKPGQNAAQVVDANVRRRSINIFSRKGAPVIAVQDGEVKAVGES